MITQSLALCGGWRPRKGKYLARSARPNVGFRSKAEVKPCSVFFWFTLSNGHSSGRSIMSEKLSGAEVVFFIDSAICQGLEPDRL
jgi:hypothetical protein